MPDNASASKPDFLQGFPLDRLPDRQPVSGRVGETAAVLVRNGRDVFAVGGHCTHYHGPLADGLVVGDTIRCPWHHACFNLKTGEACARRRSMPISCWRVDRRGQGVHHRRTERRDRTGAPLASRTVPTSVVIVGGGAAGLAAADMLRREGYDGPITMFSADDYATGRSAESVEGLSGGHGAGGLDSAARIRLLRRTPHRARPEYARRDARRDAEARPARERAAHAFDRSVDRDGRRPGASGHPGCACRSSFSTCAPSRTAARSSRKRRRRRASSSSARASSASRWRRLFAPADLDVHVVAPDKQPLERVMGHAVGAVRAAAPRGTRRRLPSRTRPSVALTAGGDADG